MKKNLPVTVYILLGIILFFIYKKLSKPKIVGDVVVAPEVVDNLTPAPDFSVSIADVCTKLRKLIYPYGTGFGIGYFGNSDETAIVELLNSLSASDTQKVVKSYYGLYSTELKTDLQSAENKPYWIENLKFDSIIFV